MAYTAKELSQLVQDKIYASRLSTWSAQDDISYWRGLQHKKDTQLLEAVNFYENKINRLLESYKKNIEEMDEIISGVGISVVDFKSDIKALAAKVLRLAEKYWAVRYEIEGRQKGFFVRKPVGTTYYIDLTNGNDNNNGLSTATAWKTIEKYTTVTTRSVGDIAWVRANTTEVVGAANIEVDEDGGSDYIYLKGCSSQSGEDPWGDGSDVKPIINFNNGAYCLNFDYDHRWYVSRLNIRNSNHSVGVLRIADSHKLYFKDVDLSQGNNYRTLVINTAHNIVFDGGEIKDCPEELIRSDTSWVKFKGVTFNARSTGTVLFCQSQSNDLEFVDCSIGQTYSFTHLFRYTRKSQIILRNTKYSGGYTNLFFNRESGYTDSSFLYLEDKDKVYQAGYVDCPYGIIEKDTTIKTGNADFSIKMAPNSECSQISALLIEDSLIRAPFMVYLSSGSQKTLTVKLYAESAWTTWPTADELYLEASYYSSGTTADRTTVKSTQTISTAQTWTDFSVTFTPQRNGVVYLNVFLKKYESGKTIHVNGEVTVS